MNNEEKLDKILEHVRDINYLITLLVAAGKIKHPDERVNEKQEEIINRGWSVIWGDEE